MRYAPIHCGRYVLSLDRPLVMGILNVTPDSFSDRGQCYQLDQALRRAEQITQEGADLLDIGGESTRPSGPYLAVKSISVEEEMDRVMPILERLQGWPIPLSLDTRHTTIMREALRLAWVDLINDVSALEDEGAVDTVAPSAVGVCLVHKQGNPQGMQDNPTYRDVVQEVGTYLAQRVQLCMAAGMARERIVVDPGFGFGKTYQHNLALLKALNTVARMAQAPILAGVSRKSMLMEMTGERMPAERLGASIAANYEAMMRGAQIIRVHDVKASVQAVKVWEVMECGQQKL